MPRPPRRSNAGSKTPQAEETTGMWSLCDYADNPIILAPAALQTSLPLAVATRNARADLKNSVSQ
jgi:hypothetical protein